MADDNSSVPCYEDLYNYTCSEKGLLLPLVNEYTWSHGARAFVYLVGLLWCFLGVAIIADVFMCAIEKITSHTTTIKVASEEEESGYEEVEVKVCVEEVEVKVCVEEMKVKVCVEEVEVKVCVEEVEVKVCVEEV